MPDGYQHLEPVVVKLVTDRERVKDHDGRPPRKIHPLRSRQTDWDDRRDRLMSYYCQQVMAIVT